MTERLDRATSYGPPVPLSLEAASFAMYATVSRAAARSFESMAQAALLAHRQ